MSACNLGFIIHIMVWCACIYCKGCERAKRTGASGVRLKESVGINQGLLALGKVIRALSAGASRSPTKKVLGHSTNCNHVEVNVFFDCHGA